MKLVKAILEGKNVREILLEAENPSWGRSDVIEDLVKSFGEDAGDELRSSLTLDRNLGSFSINDEMYQIVKNEDVASILAKEKLADSISKEDTDTFFDKEILDNFYYVPKQKDRETLAKKIATAYVERVAEFASEKALDPIFCKLVGRYDEFVALGKPKDPDSNQEETSWEQGTWVKQKARLVQACKETLWENQYKKWFDNLSKEEGLLSIIGESLKSDKYFPNEFTPEYLYVRGFLKLNVERAVALGIDSLDWVIILTDGETRKFETTEHGYVYFKGGR